MRVFAISVPSRVSGLSGIVRLIFTATGQQKACNNGKLGEFVRLVRHLFNSLTHTHAPARVWCHCQFSLGTYLLTGQAGQIKLSD